MEEIYVVTSGYYSDYRIEAIFKDKAKAESYCDCHRDCTIEEYNFSDDDIFTTFNLVVISFSIKENWINEPYFKFYHLAKEDYSDLCGNRDRVAVEGNNKVSFFINRLLPNNYDEQKIRDKYTKVCQDIRAEILYLLSEMDSDSYENRKATNEKIAEYIKGRFGIEKDN